MNVLVRFDVVEEGQVARVVANFNKRHGCIIAPLYGTALSVLLMMLGSNHLVLVITIIDSIA